MRMDGWSAFPSLATFLATCDATAIFEASRPPNSNGTFPVCLMTPFSPKAAHYSVRSEQQVCEQTPRLASRFLH